MTQPTYATSVTIDRSPGEVYDLLSDVVRMPEWSPEVVASWWDDESDSPAAAAGRRFRGRNQWGEAEWEAECEIAAAERGRLLAWIVNGGEVQWVYTFVELEGGRTLLTETWTFLEPGIEVFRTRFADLADGLVAKREAKVRETMPATLDAIRRAAESAPRT